MSKHNFNNQTELMQHLLRGDSIYCPSWTVNNRLYLKDGVLTDHLNQEPATLDLSDFANYAPYEEKVIITRKQFYEAARNAEHRISFQSKFIGYKEAFDLLAKELGL